MDKITLYHISFDPCELLEKTFIPRIPSNTISEEDESIPRICLCDSIEGCINAAEDKLLGEEDSIAFIVWEKEFSLLDPFLMEWKELYEKGLVPDAALTHEYWYTRSVTMKGSLYEITDVQKAIRNKRTAYIVKHKYRDLIEQVLSRYGVDIEKIKTIDTSSIINTWVPSVFCGEEYETVLEKLKDVMRIVEEEHREDDISLFEEKSGVNKVLDMLPQAIYCDLDIKKKFTKS